MFIKGRLIDGTGREPESAVIEIAGGKIKNITRNHDLDLGEDCLDLSGMTIMPGLMDAHVHLWGVRTMDYFKRLVVPEELNLLRAGQDLKKIIEAGYTSIRDAGSRSGIFLRQAVEEGTLPGPRIKTPGLVINQTGGHLDKHFIPLEEARGKKTVCRIADGPDECRRAVREQFRAGADYIKICVTGGLTGEKESPEDTQFCESEIKAILEEAAAKGAKVAAHAQGLKGTRQAVDWGVPIIEHGVFLDEALCEAMVEKNVLLVPTLTVSHKFAYEGEKYNSPPWAVEKAKRVHDAHVASFRLAHQTGVTIGAGTDCSGSPLLLHGKNAIELEMMVKAGFQPMEAIVAATRTNSLILGIDEHVGTIESGKDADLIVVEGDPLTDICILQDAARIKLVMKGGEILKSSPAEK